MKQCGGDRPNHGYFYRPQYLSVLRLLHQLRFAFCPTAGSRVATPAGRSADMNEDTEKEQDHVFFVFSFGVISTFPELSGCIKGAGR